MSISALINTAQRALAAQTQAIRITGDNIANVNIPGYSRRRGDFVSTDINPATGVGTGVELAQVTRIVDNFINKQLVDATGQRAFSDIRSDLLSRMEEAFSVEGGTDQINTAMTEFFSSLEDLSTNPSDLALRDQVLQAGQHIVATISDTYNQVAGLQREADNRIGSLVLSVNQITSGIAEINRGIVQQEVGGQEALGLRDSRDELMRQLGELVSFQTVDNPDGTNQIYLSNGFGLVTGATARTLEFTVAPSFENAPPNNFPPGLDGQGLGHIVYDFGSGSHVDLTSVIRGTGSGEIAGLLSLRGVQPNPGTPTRTFDADGDLVTIGAKVEAIARDLLTRFNFEYLGPDNVAGGVHNPSSYDLNGNLPTTVGTVPGAFSLFSFTGAGSQTNAGDIDGDGIPEATDLSTIVGSGVGNITSFARILTLNVTTASQFAAGRDTNLATAGVQSAAGDSQNIQGLLSQRQALVTYTNPGFSSTFSQQATIEGFYGLTASETGALTRKAQDDLTVYTAREEQTKALQTSASGVSLDEEFANLINFQRAFQGAARMIRTGDELFDEIVALLG